MMTRASRTPSVVACLREGESAPTPFRRLERVSDSHEGVAARRANAVTLAAIPANSAF